MINDIILLFVDTTVRFILSILLYLGSVFPAVGLLILGYLGCDPTLFIVILCLTTAFDGFRGSGLGVNLIDIAPNYAGATMGVVNTAGNIMGFVAPFIVGLLLSEGVSTFSVSNIRLNIYLKL